jgi:hypothetical protein
VRAGVDPAVRNETGLVGELETDGDGSTLEAVAQSLGPGADGSGAMLEDGALSRPPLNGGIVGRTRECLTVGREDRWAT